MLSPEQSRDGSATLLNGGRACSSAILRNSRNVNCSTHNAQSARCILGIELVAGLGSQIAVGQAVIPQDVAVVPKFLDEGGGIAHD
jgi:hypothetical protein